MSKQFYIFEYDLANEILTRKFSRNEIKCLLFIHRLSINCKSKIFAIIPEINDFKICGAGNIDRFKNETLRKLLEENVILTKKVKGLTCYAINPYYFSWKTESVSTERWKNPIKDLNSMIFGNTFTKDSKKFNIGRFKSTKKANIDRSNKIIEYISKGELEQYLEENKDICDLFCSYQENKYFVGLENKVNLSPFKDYENNSALKQELVNIDLEIILNKLEIKDNEIEGRLKNCLEQ
jgi:hypothetical protein